MKSEYVNESAVALNPTDSEVTILFNLNYVDFKYDGAGAGKETAFAKTGICKVMMSVGGADKLMKSLTECLEQYQSYLKKISEDMPNAEH